jgi:hypothetical protein
LKSLYKLILIGILLCLLSCQPIYKLITGVRNPVPYKTTLERVEYYEPWLDNQIENTIIYTINSPWSYKAVFEGIAEVDFPVMLVYSKQTNAVYKFDCYEDLYENAIDYHRGNYDQISLADTRIRKYIDSISIHFIDSLDYTKRKIIKKTKDQRTTVKIVNAAFLGKKVRRRITVALQELQPIDSLIIYDMSISRNEKPQKG